ncbi:hypothetical protein O6H91_03G062700 [Diphasiastrum complanatum]|uniref:Uncharacterized protein n=2 Tax=Diphasiastrum complanatum TaxID=34168 RepID=A0ACC2E7N9_DIPCM|nr:hypothetical protein O6H91_03G062700 [Diphasiastrum complanatum]KAJ7562292.1 hypothetical protein O6H91_03G062700 [Diphasiastrum complanatum]
MEISQPTSILSQSSSTINTTSIHASMEHLQTTIRDMEAFDAAHADVIQMLLATPSPHAMKRYYNQLASEGIGPWLKVQYIGQTMGKGVFAAKDFDEGEVVLREPKLVGIQNAHSKEDSLVCSFCFCYVGSLELQLRWKLFARGHLRPIRGTNLQGDSQGTDNQCLEQHARVESDGDERICDPPSSVSTSCLGTEICNYKCRSDESEEQSAKRRALSFESFSWISDDALRLPFGDVFPLPHIVECRGGCHEDLFCSFCSEACAEAAWEAYHCLLCTGSKSLCPNKSLLSEFKQFADETNDIFHLAAQVIANVICKCRKLESVATEVKSEEDAKARNTRMLLEAWEPFAMGHKRLWWESIALPEDVDPAEEDVFRNQMKELAANSLGLLKKVLFMEEYAALFSLEVYGYIIGMFELNNLEIVVASPVEDYFIYIDELPHDAKCEAKKITKPALEALGEDYASYCQGTGFFAIQSCMNHSCEPNAKAFKRDEDRDGQAVLLAIRKIEEGEEVTISYIDEHLPLEERQLMLADYGFACQCSKCLQDREASLN